MRVCSKYGGASIAQRNAATHWTCAARSIMFQIVSVANLAAFPWNHLLHNELELIGSNARALINPILHGDIKK